MINYIAVGAAVILNMAIGMAWYSPALFGTIWAKGIKFKGKPEMGILHLIQGLCVGLLVALGFAHLLYYLAIITVYNAISTASMVWLGFVVPTHYNGVIWAQKPLSVFFVDAGYYLVSFSAIAALLVWWQ